MSTPDHTPEFGVQYLMQSHADMHVLSLIVNSDTSYFLGICVARILLVCVGMNIQIEQLGIWTRYQVQDIDTFAKGLSESS